MKKGCMIVFLLLLCMVLSLSGCGNRTLTFELNDIQKVVLTSPSGKVENVITDTDTIRQITDSIASIPFRRERSVRDINGFGITVEWYAGSGERILSISVDDDQSIHYDGQIWKAQEGSINMKLLSDLITAE